jgi:hypothetical protein
MCFSRNSFKGNDKGKRAYKLQPNISKMKVILFIIGFCCAMLLCSISSAQQCDAVVSPGQSIQATIEAAPATPVKPYIIFIKMVFTMGR